MKKHRIALDVKEQIINRIKNDCTSPHSSDTNLVWGNGSISGL